MQTKSKKRPPSRGAEFWSEHIRKWESLKLSKSEYCKQNNLSRFAFYYWHKKLNQKEAVSPGNAIVPMPFQVQDLKSSQTKPLCLKLGQRFQIDIQGDFNPSVLKKLIKTLEDLS